MSHTMYELALARRAITALEAYKQHQWSGDPRPSAQALDAIAAWPGWGPLARPLDGSLRETLEPWKSLHDRLHELLTRRELAAAKNAARHEDRSAAVQASDTSFYTPPAVATAMWRALTGLGFTGGPVLEPGCGHGGAFLGSAPAEMDITWTGVEMDPTSAGMARLLFPHAAIINKPLEATPLRPASHAAAIGNVPFAKDGPYDPTFPDDAGYSPNLHNYFIWKALQAVAPGGLVALITSRYTMDAASPAGREFLSRFGVLIGAIRLPVEVFDRQGARVVADILVLRRRTPADPCSGAAWMDAAEHPDLPGVWINEYFTTHPDMVLGQSTVRTTKHGADLEVFADDPAETPQLLDRAVDRVIGTGRDTGLVFTASDAVPAPAPVEDVEGKEGAFSWDADGTVHQIIEGRRTPVPAKAELIRLIELRDAALDLFDADADLSRSDTDVDQIRTHARALYDTYTARYGPLQRCTLSDGKPDPETGLATVVRRRPPMAGFRVDPDFPTLLALEEFDDETLTARPAPILLRRVNTPPVRKTRADDPAEAVALCRDQRGDLHLPTLAALLDLDEDHVLGVLGDAVYLNPGTGRWESAADYLSGDVRAKLAAARAAADDPALGRNVTALEAVQPADKDAGQIKARLGSPFLHPRDIEAFIVDLFDLHNGFRQPQVKVAHEPFTGSWEVTAPDARRHIAATTTYGTARVNAVDLIAQALNLNLPEVYDTQVVYDPDLRKDKEIRVRNHTESQLAEERQKRIQEEFVTWIWRDGDRADRIVRTYNDRYNNQVPRRWSRHVTVPGLISGFRPYDHQLEWVDRSLSSTGFEINGFKVGGGKTFSEFAAAAKLRSVGLIRKPLIIVPNHLLEQIASDGRRLFPGHRILMVTREDLTPKRRRYFAAKVAATDWDTVVMTHEQFTSIPVSRQMELDFLADLINQCERAVHASGEKGGRAVKMLAKMVRRYRKRHAELMDRAHEDTGLTIDQLGVDYIAVDEFHFFTRLYTPTRISGFSLPSSKRAEHLFTTLAWLRRTRPGKPIGAGYTGTVMTNTMAEAYTLLRFTDPDGLAEKGLASFDAFAGMFINFATKVEVRPDGGGFRRHRRPATWSNGPELQLMLREHCDVRTRSMLNLAGPRVTLEKITVPAPPELPGIIADIVDRADAIRRGTPGKITRVDGTKGKDNHLLVCTDGRKASVDPRLVGVVPTGETLLQVAARNIAGIYHANTGTVLHDPDGDNPLFPPHPGVFQLAFLDLGVPGTEPLYDADGNQIMDADRAYGVLRDWMVHYGVPREKIAFGHDVKNLADRKAQYAACNDGGIAVLVTSTRKTGTGANIQRRMRAIHHIDAPWRPDELEQRDGRGDRPGNLNPDLAIFWYAVTGSFAPYMWQTLARKRAFLDQLWSGTLAREIDDVLSMDALDMDHMKAIATGMQLLLDLEEARAEVARLTTLAIAHDADQGRLRRTWRALERARRDAAHTADVLTRIAAGDTGQEKLVNYISHWNGRDAAADILAKVARDAIRKKTIIKAGTWRGIDVEFSFAADDTTRVQFRLAPAKSTDWTDWTDLPRGFQTPGQEWRLVAALDKVIDAARADAADAARRGEHLDLQIQQARDGLNVPFPDADALAAATARQRDLEHRIEDLTAPAPAPAAFAA